MRGSCLCGAIRFEITGAPGTLYQCHCALCRKQSGATSSTALIVAQSDFVWLHGQEQVASWVRPTGFRSDFCSCCGAPVPNPLRSSPYYWVPAGLLDEAPDLTVTLHLHTASKAEWDAIPPAIQQFEAAPDTAEMVRLLHTNR